MSTTIREQRFQKTDKPLSFDTRSSTVQGIIDYQRAHKLGSDYYLDPLKPKYNKAQVRILDALSGCGKITVKIPQLVDDALFWASLRPNSPKIDRRTVVREMPDSAFYKCRYPSFD